MTKQLLKGLWAVGLVAALAAVSAPVEAAEITCKIPFSFTVGGKTLPPGPYRVSNNQGVLFVRGFGRGVFVQTLGLESRKDRDAKLVFHKYGDRYILRQAWMGGGAGRELPPPRQERSLAGAAQDGKAATRLERVVIPAL